MTREQVPMEKWAKDHWATLAYIETRVVDHHGVIDNDNMRTDVTRHPRFIGNRQRLFGVSHDTKYPTRLKEGEIAEDHDDWDCLYDMKRSGLVRIVSPRNVKLWDVDAGRRGPINGSPEGLGVIRVRVALTDSGKIIAAELRIHKMRQKNFSSFVPGSLASV